MAGMENLRRIVDQICRDKGIDRDLLIDAIEEAVRSAVKKKYGGQRDIEVQYNDELGEVEVFQYRTVVEKVVNEAREISLEEARREWVLNGSPCSNTGSMTSACFLKTTSGFCVSSKQPIRGVSHGYMIACLP